MNKADSIFSKLLAETAKVIGVPVMAISISGGTKKRWSDLALYWERRRNRLQNIFQKALFHIATGKRLPTEPRLKELVSLIEQAILEIPDALAGWRDLEWFKKSFFQVVRGDARKGLGSTEVRYFIYHRLLLNTFQNKEKLLTKELWRVSHRGFVRQKEMADIKHSATLFMNAVKQMLPTAASWPEHYFTSEHRIFSELMRHHGLTYDQCVSLFDDLIEIIECKLDGRTYYHRLFAMEHDIPDSLAGLIWPQDMEKEFHWQLSVLLRQGSNAYSLFYDPWKDPAVINETWAFKKIRLWCSDPRSRVSRKMRRNILDISFGIHPADS